MKRPTSLTIIAWVMIVSFGIGALTNIYGVVASVPPYPKWVWVVLLALKCAGLVSGILLLRMQRLAVLLYLAAAIAGWLLSFGVTNEYTPVGAWRYIAGLLVMGIYAFFVVRHWDKFLPTQPVIGTESREAAE